MKKTTKVKRVTAAKKIESAYALRLPVKTYALVKKTAKTKGVTISYILNKAVEKFLDI